MEPGAKYPSADERRRVLPWWVSARKWRPPCADGLNSRARRELRRTAEMQAAREAAEVLGGAVAASEAPGPYPDTSGMLRVGRGSQLDPQGFSSRRNPSRCFILPEGQIRKRILSTQFLASYLYSYTTFRVFTHQ